MPARLWIGLVLSLSAASPFPAVAQDPVARAPGSIEVTPKGGSAVVVGPGSNTNVNFQVTSTRPSSTNVDLVCQVSGQVVSCLPDQSTFTLGAFQSIDVAVEITSGSVGTGHISLYDVNFSGDSGWRPVTVQGVSAPR